MGDSSAPPAGWFPDPDGARAWRWWNGQDWEQRTSPFPARAGAVAGPASWLAPVAALSPGLGIVASLVIQRSYDAARTPLEAAQRSGVVHWTPALVAVAIAAVIGLAGELAVVAWLLRAGQLARSLGYTLTVAPALGAWTWLVPIVKILLPYRLLRDLVPLGHPLRARVRASWLAFLAYQLASLAMGLSPGTTSATLMVVVAAVGIAWWSTFALVVLATSRGLAEAART